MSAGVRDDSHDAWIRQVVDLDNRQDAVPSLNGVAAGQTWRNRHTGHVITAVEGRLAGWGTSTGHSSTVVFEDSVFEEWNLPSLDYHWEHVRRIGLDEPETVLVEERYGGQLVVDVITERWEVLPSPLEGQDLDAITPVIHRRPIGPFHEWEGKKRTRWRLHKNRILLCKRIREPCFLAVAAFKGYSYEHMRKGILVSFPDAAPGPEEGHVLLLG